MDFEYFGDGCKILKTKGKQVLLTVSTFKKLGWKIVSVVPIDEITSENREIIRLIIIIGVICLVFAS